MFALLGSITLGLGGLTGPTASSEAEKATFARHAVAEGKPVVQDMGDELSTKKLSFFFDEGFCDPEAELANLKLAFDSREPLPFVPGDGSYTGARYVIEAIDVELKRTTLAGRITRLEAQLTLIEFPVQDLLAFELAFSLATAPAVSVGVGLSGGGISVGASAGLGPVGLDIGLNIDLLA